MEQKSQKRYAQKVFFLFITYKLYSDVVSEFTLEQTLTYLHSQGINLEKKQPETIGILHLDGHVQLIIVVSQGD